MNVRPLWLRFFVACCVLAAGIAAAQSPASTYTEPAAQLDRFLVLMAERLALMEQVAAFKQANNQPIPDPLREAELLADLTAQGEGMGLARDGLQPLFELQFEWARTEQANWQERWRSGKAKPPSGVPDLATHLRPQLDRIGHEMLVALYLALPALADPAQLELARGRALVAMKTLPEPEAAVRTLLTRLGAIRAFRIPALARIRTSGVLRVGTTGDYAPFSSDAGVALTGIDIDLAHDLAASLGVTPRFVHTSWPSLAQDLKAGRFDVALSGITITDARREVGDFSDPYYDGGKVPIARCGDVERFDTLAEIDRPTTRLIVNPGGTNERFARDNLPHSTLTLHPDNRTIFDEIVAGRADVMVTDDIEVTLVTRREPRLCRASPQPFTHDDKSVFMTRDPMLRERVNTWLDHARSAGVVRRLFAEALR